MTRRWFSHLSVDEKAIKFGLTRPSANAAIYYAPRSSRHVSLPSNRNIRSSNRPARRHLLSRPESARRRGGDGVSVELLPSVPLFEEVNLMEQFEGAVESVASALPERLLVRSEVRRVRIDEGIIAFEMTRISSRMTGTAVERIITLYFGMVPSGEPVLQIARITAREESSLRQQRGAVAAFLRRWGKTHDSTYCGRVASFAI